MRVQDLIALLEDMDPDTEVRIAEQPHWPFEYSVRGLVQGLNGWSDEDDEELADLETEIATMDKEDPDYEGYLEERNRQMDLRKNATPVVYIVEGSQLGYTSKSLWDQV